MLSSPGLAFKMADCPPESKQAALLYNPTQLLLDTDALRAVYEGKADLKNALGHLTKLDAFRLFACLPIPLSIPYPLPRFPHYFPQEDLLGSHSYQELVAAYLSLIDLGVSVRPELAERLEPVYDCAMVSWTRFNMIRRMCELGAFEYENPAVHWILSEASKFIN
ncbi:MAG: hypothetical protein AAGL17_26390, partial [Cyanobacteria bacterium J06576_12]